MLSTEETALTALVEQLGIEARSLQLLDVLIAQPFVGCKDEYAVEFLGMMFLCIIEILLDVDMQHQGFSRTSGAPER